MKYILSIVVVAGILLNTEAGAQRRPKQQRNDYGGSQQTPTQPGADTSVKGAPNNYGAAVGAAQTMDTSLPVTVIKSSGNGLLDTVKMSLRNDGAVQKNLVKERTPLPYEDIREDDAVFMVRVWRLIDAREKMNLGFRYAADGDNGNQRFISILLQAIKDGEITAFSGDDDRFTTPVTADVAMNAFGGGFDTSIQYDDDGNAVGRQVRPKATSPDSIYKFEVKEEWIFDKESSRMFVRIIGIAPVMSYKLSTGEIAPNSERPLWWVYYPDLRPVLSKYDVYNPKNIAAQMTWEELFESRMFSSYILKSSIDNNQDMPLSSLYPSNTLFRLLEGEKIKDKIFNYEQSLWSY